jgi:hypothetical protein
MTEDIIGFGGLLFTFVGGVFYLATKIEHINSEAKDVKTRLNNHERKDDKRYKRIFKRLDKLLAERHL